MRYCSNVTQNCVIKNDDSLSHNYDFLCNYDTIHNIFKRWESAFLNTCICLFIYLLCVPTIWFKLRPFRPVPTAHAQHFHTCAGFRAVCRCSIMAAASSRVEQASPVKTAPPIAAGFDLSDPPVIDGFTPLSRPREEGFKDKFIRKTKENPFVPIGEF